MSLLLALTSVTPTTPGAPWYLWQTRIQRDDPEIIVPPALNYQALYGRTTPLGTSAGAPWYLWQSARNQPETADIQPSVDLQAIHRYRPGFQTVGQPVWSLYWRGRVPEAQEVAYTPPAPVNLYQYHGTFTVPVGQAWLMWPKARMPEAAEEPLYRFDYGKYQMLYGRTRIIPTGPIPHYEINLGLSLSRFGGKF